MRFLIQHSGVPDTYASFHQEDGTVLTKRKDIVKFFMENQDNIQDFKNLFSNTVQQCRLQNVEPEIVILEAKVYEKFCKNKIYTGCEEWYYIPVLTLFGIKVVSDYPVF